MTITPISSLTVYKPKDLSPTLKKEILRAKIIYIALSVFTLGIYSLIHLGVRQLKVKVLNRLFMPATLRNKKTYHLPHWAKSFAIEKRDGKKLHAAEYLNPNAKENRWMIFLPGNDTRFEGAIEEYHHLANDLGVNLLMFNYRGIGLSEGVFYSASQLKIDAATCIEYLKEFKQADEKNVLLFGHSQGGGVAAETDVHYPEARVVNDRSYASTAKVASTVGTAVLGSIVKTIGYQIDAHKAWMKIPEAQKLIIYHHRDEVIHYHKAGLYKSVKKALKKLHPEWTTAKTAGSKLGSVKEKALKDAHKPNRVKLRFVHDGLKTGAVPAGVHHCYSICPLTEPKVYIEMVEKIRALFPVAA